MKGFKQSEKFLFEENKSFILPTAVEDTPQNCCQWTESFPLSFRVLHLGKARSLISPLKTIQNKSVSRRDGDI